MRRRGRGGSCSLCSPYADVGTQTPSRSGRVQQGLTDGWSRRCARRVRCHLRAQPRKPRRLRGAAPAARHAPPAGSNARPARLPR